VDCAQPAAAVGWWQPCCRDLGNWVSWAISVLVAFERGDGTEKLQLIGCQVIMAQKLFERGTHRFDSTAICEGDVGIFAMQNAQVSAKQLS
jgi:hypothetical protein